MRRIIYGFGILLIMLTALSACSKDNDSALELSGTHWIKTTDNSRYFTFTNKTEYVYVEGSDSASGTYTFDGTNGVFQTKDEGNIDFKVNGNILSVNQNDDSSDFESIYEKQ